MSLTMTSKASADDLTIWRYSLLGIRRRLSAPVPVMPTMPLSGVRISLAHVGQNSPLAGLAASAASRASVKPWI